ncbi:6-phosphogluconolactonase (cycloisomerase 2 family) [Nocardia kruczakiae]|uniref:6-phosphogluconolactonase (Cycloisomerase 2 family) n=1 Tax=Nocardia kruczakiae TaxID=261477 RepID=A0ABU1XAA4_9NOCA|nr:beta-propeller fold lactonase family protein [Nocardia kruczakiae]MDR7166962.1 6-phosphogluconolactonase (cycloisomerase 2 family) [Nocardia kruczakiae]
MFHKAVHAARGAAVGVATAVAVTCGGWSGSAIAATPDRYLVIAGAASSNIEVLRVDGVGALSNVGGSPFPAGTGALSLTATPDGRTVYVAHTVSGTISGYHLNADGTLSRIPGAQLDLGTPAVGFTISPDGSRMFATIGGATNEVRSYRIDASGALSPTGAQATPIPGISGLTMPTLSPDGRFLFLASWLNMTVSSFAVQPDGGLRAVGGPVFAGMQPTLHGVTPDGRFLYVSNEASDGVAGFAIAVDGRLTPTPGSPYRVGFLPHGVAITADSHRLYVPASMGGAIGGFTIGGDGALIPVPGSPYAAPAGTIPGRVVLDEAAGKVFLIDALTAHGTTQVHSYTIAEDGSLAPSGVPVTDTGLVFSDGPDAILTAPQ